MVTRLAGLRAGMWKWLGTGAALLVCVTLTGCIGATPLPKRTRTPEGTEVKDVDLTFIHPGQTTRAEIREKLKLLDAGAS
jgi:outer membrane protein assembly factor BamE (lipoprotein component of BamABCDE complex)